MVFSVVITDKLLNNATRSTGPNGLIMKRRMIMDNTVKIVLLHLFLLAVQGFYMFVSNRQQLKDKRYLYPAAIPIVGAMPVLLHSQSPHVYSVYEYAIVICMITAAMADVSYVVLTNKEYLTDAAIRRFHYSYFLICLIAAFCGGIRIWVKAACILLLAGIICWSCLIKKHSRSEPIKAIPLALFSYACAWVFVKYVLEI